MLSILMHFPFCISTRNSHRSLSLVGSVWLLSMIAHTVSDSLSSGTGLITAVPTQQLRNISSNNFLIASSSFSPSAAEKFMSSANEHPFSLIEKLLYETKTFTPLDTEIPVATGLQLMQSSSAETFILKSTNLLHSHSQTFSLKTLPLSSSFNEGQVSHSPTKSLDDILSDEYLSLFSLLTKESSSKTSIFSSVSDSTVTMTSEPSTSLKCLPSEAKQVTFSSKNSDFSIRKDFVPDVQTLSPTNTLVTDTLLPSFSKAFYTGLSKSPNTQISGITSSSEIILSTEASYRIPHFTERFDSDGQSATQLQDWKLATYTGDLSVKNTDMSGKDTLEQSLVSTIPLITNQPKDSSTKLTASLFYEQSKLKPLSKETMSTDELEPSSLVETSHQRPNRTELTSNVIIMKSVSQKLLQLFQNDSSIDSHELQPSFTDMLNAQLETLHLSSTETFFTETAMLFSSVTEVLNIVPSLTRTKGTVTETTTDILEEKYFTPNIAPSHTRFADIAFMLSNMDVLNSWSLSLSLSSETVSPYFYDDQEALSLSPSFSSTETPNIYLNSTPEINDIPLTSLLTVKNSSIDTMVLPNISERPFLESRYSSALPTDNLSTSIVSSLSFTQSSTLESTPAWTMIDEMYRSSSSSALDRTSSVSENLPPISTTISLPEEPMKSLSIEQNNIMLESASQEPIKSKFIDTSSSLVLSKQDNASQQSAEMVFTDNLEFTSALTKQIPLQPHSLSVANGKKLSSETSQLFPSVTDSVTLAVVNMTSSPISSFTSPVESDLLNKRMSTPGLVLTRDSSSFTKLEITHPQNLSPVTAYFSTYTSIPFSSFTEIMISDPPIEFLLSVEATSTEKIDISSLNTDPDTQEPRSQYLLSVSTGSKFAFTTQASLLTNTVHESSAVSLLVDSHELLSSFPYPESSVSKKPSFSMTDVLGTHNIAPGYTGRLSTGQTYISPLNELTGISQVTTGVLSTKTTQLASLFTNAINSEPQRTPLNYTNVVQSETLLISPSITGLDVTKPQRTFAENVSTETNEFSPLCSGLKIPEQQTASVETSSTERSELSLSVTEIKTLDQLITSSETLATVISDVSPSFTRLMNFEERTAAETLSIETNEISPQFTKIKTSNQLKTSLETLTSETKELSPPFTELKTSYQGITFLEALSTETNELSSSFTGLKMSEKHSTVVDTLFTERSELLPSPTELKNSYQRKSSLETLGTNLSEFPSSFITMDISVQHRTAVETLSMEIREISPSVTVVDTSDQHKTYLETLSIKTSEVKPSFIELKTSERHETFLERIATEKSGLSSSVTGIGTSEQHITLVGISSSEISELSTSVTEEKISDQYQASLEILATQITETSPFTELKLMTSYQSITSLEILATEISEPSLSFTELEISEQQRTFEDTLSAETKDMSPSFTALQSSNQSISSLETLDTVRRESSPSFTGLEVSEQQITFAEAISTETNDLFPSLAELNSSYQIITSTETLAKELSELSPSFTGLKISEQQRTFTDILSTERNELSSSFSGQRQSKQHTTVLETISTERIELSPSFTGQGISEQQSIFVEILSTESNELLPSVSRLIMLEQHTTIIETMSTARSELLPSFTGLMISELERTFADTLSTEINDPLASLIGVKISYKNITSLEILATEINKLSPSFTGLEISEQQITFSQTLFTAINELSPSCSGLNNSEQHSTVEYTISSEGIGPTPSFTEQGISESFAENVSTATNDLLPSLIELKTSFQSITSIETLATGISELSLLFNGLEISEQQTSFAETLSTETNDLSPSFSKLKTSYQSITSLETLSTEISELSPPSLTGLEVSDQQRTFVETLTTETNDLSSPFSKLKTSYQIITSLEILAVASTEINEFSHSFTGLEISEQRSYARTLSTETNQLPPLFSRISNSEQHKLVVETSSTKKNELSRTFTGLVISEQQRIVADLLSTETNYLAPSFPGHPGTTSLKALATEISELSILFTGLEISDQQKTLTENLSTEAIELSPSFTKLTSSNQSITSLEILATEISKLSSSVPELKIAEQHRTFSGTLATEVSELFPPFTELKMSEQTREITPYLVSMTAVETSETYKLPLPSDTVSVSQKSQFTGTLKSADFDLLQSSVNTWSPSDTSVISLNTETLDIFPVSTEKSVKSTSSLKPSFNILNITETSKSLNRSLETLTSKAILLSPSLTELFTFESYKSSSNEDIRTKTKSLLSSLNEISTLEALQQSPLQGSFLTRTNQLPSIIERISLDATLSHLITSFNEISTTETTDLLMLFSGEVSKETLPYSSRNEVLISEMLNLSTVSTDTSFTYIQGLKASSLVLHTEASITEMLSYSETATRLSFSDNVFYTFTPSLSLAFTETTDLESSFLTSVSTDKPFNGNTIHPSSFLNDLISEITLAFTETTYLESSLLPSVSTDKPFNGNTIHPSSFMNDLISDISNVYASSSSSFTTFPELRVSQFSPRSFTGEQRFDSSASSMESVFLKHVHLPSTHLSTEMLPPSSQNTNLLTSKMKHESVSSTQTLQEEPLLMPSLSSLFLKTIKMSSLPSDISFTKTAEVTKTLHVSVSSLPSAISTINTEIVNPIAPLTEIISSEAISDSSISTETPSINSLPLTSYMLTSHIVKVLPSSVGRMQTPYNILPTPTFKITSLSSSDMDVFRIFTKDVPSKVLLSLETSGKYSPSSVESKIFSENTLFVSSMLSEIATSLPSFDTLSAYTKHVTLTSINMDDMIKSSRFTASCSSAPLSSFSLSSMPMEATATLSFLEDKTPELSTQDKTIVSVSTTYTPSSLIHETSALFSSTKGSTSFSNLIEKDTTHLLRTVSILESSFTSTRDTLPLSISPKYIDLVPFDFTSTKQSSAISSAVSLTMTYKSLLTSSSARNVSMTGDTFLMTPSAIPVSTSTTSAVITTPMVTVSSLDHSERSSSTFLSSVTEIKDISSYIVSLSPEQIASMSSKSVVAQVSSFTSTDDLPQPMISSTEEIQTFISSIKAQLLPIVTTEIPSLMSTIRPITPLSLTSSEVGKPAFVESMDLSNVIKAVSGGILNKTTFLSQKIGSTTSDIIQPTSTFPEREGTAFTTPELEISLSSSPEVEALPIFTSSLGQILYSSYSSLETDSFSARARTPVPSLKPSAIDISPANTYSAIFSTIVTTYSILHPHTMPIFDTTSLVPTLLSLISVPLSTMNIPSEISTRMVFSSMDDKSSLTPTPSAKTTTSEKHVSSFTEQWLMPSSVAGEIITRGSLSTNSAIMPSRRMLSSNRTVLETTPLSVQAHARGTLLSTKSGSIPVGDVTSFSTTANLGSLSLQMSTYEHVTISTSATLSYVTSSTLTHTSSGTTHSPKEIDQEQLLTIGILIKSTVDVKSMTVNVRIKEGLKRCYIEGIAKVAKPGYRKKRADSNVTAEVTDITRQDAIPAHVDVDFYILVDGVVQPSAEVLAIFSRLTVAETSAYLSYPVITPVKLVSEPTIQQIPKDRNESHIPNLMLLLIGVPSICAAFATIVLIILYCRKTDRTLRKFGSTLEDADLKIDIEKGEVVSASINRNKSLPLFAFDNGKGDLNSVWNNMKPSLHNNEMPFKRSVSEICSASQRLERLRKLGFHVSEIRKTDNQTIEIPVHGHDDPQTDVDHLETCGEYKILNDLGKPTNQSRVVCQAELKSEMISKSNAKETRRISKSNCKNISQDSDVFLSRNSLSPLEFEANIKPARYDSLSNISKLIDSLVCHSSDSDTGSSQNVGSKRSVKFKEDMPHEKKRKVKQNKKVKVVHNANSKSRELKNNLNEFIQRETQTSRPRVPSIPVEGNCSKVLHEPFYSSLTLGTDPPVVNNFIEGDIEDEVFLTDNTQYQDLTEKDRQASESENIPTSREIIPKLAAKQTKQRQVKQKTKDKKSGNKKNLNARNKCDIIRTCNVEENSAGTIGVHQNNLDHFQQQTCSHVQKSLPRNLLETWSDDSFNLKTCCDNHTDGSEYAGHEFECLNFNREYTTSTEGEQPCRRHLSQDTTQDSSMAEGVVGPFPGMYEHVTKMGRVGKGHRDLHSGRSSGPQFRKLPFQDQPVPVAKSSTPVPSMSPGGRDQVIMRELPKLQYIFPKREVMRDMGIQTVKPVLKRETIYENGIHTHKRSTIWQSEDTNLQYELDPFNDVIEGKKSRGKRGSVFENEPGTGDTNQDLDKIPQKKRNSLLDGNNVGKRPGNDGGLKTPRDTCTRKKPSESKNVLENGDGGTGSSNDNGIFYEKEKDHPDDMNFVSKESDNSEYNEVPKTEHTTGRRELDDVGREATFEDRKMLPQKKKDHPNDMDMVKQQRDNASRYEKLPEKEHANGRKTISESESDIENGANDTNGDTKTLPEKKKNQRKDTDIDSIKMDNGSENEEVSKAEHVTGKKITDDADAYPHNKGVHFDPKGPEGIPNESEAKFKKPDQLKCKEKGLRNKDSIGKETGFEGEEELENGHDRKDGIENGQGRKDGALFNVKNKPKVDRQVTGKKPHVEFGDVSFPEIPDLNISIPSDRPKPKAAFTPYVEMKLGRNMRAAPKGSIASRMPASDVNPQLDATEPLLHNQSLSSNGVAEYYANTHSAPPPQSQGSGNSSRQYPARSITSPQHPSQDLIETLNRNNLTSLTQETRLREDEQRKAAEHQERLEATLRKLQEDERKREEERRETKINFEQERQEAILEAQHKRDEDHETKNTLLNDAFGLTNTPEIVTPAVNTATPPPPVNLYGSYRMKEDFFTETKSPEQVSTQPFTPQNSTVFSQEGETTATTSSLRGTNSGFTVTKAVSVEKQETLDDVEYDIEEDILVEGNDSDDAKIKEDDFDF